MVDDDDRVRAAVHEVAHVARGSGGGDGEISSRVAGDVADECSSNDPTRGRGVGVVELLLLLPIPDTPPVVFA